MCVGEDGVGGLGKAGRLAIKRLTSNKINSDNSNHYQKAPIIE